MRDRAEKTVSTDTRGAVHETTTENNQQTENELEMVRIQTLRSAFHKLINNFRNFIDIQWLFEIS